MSRQEPRGSQGSQITFKVAKEKANPKSTHNQGACTWCKSKRRKCDGKYPVCSLCENAGVECTIKDATTGRVIPRNYIEQLEKKVAELQRSAGTPTKNNATEAPRRRDLEMEVGYITLGAGSESVGYIGDSSAYSIARAITSTIDYYSNPTKNSSTPEDIQRELDQIPFVKPSLGMAYNYLSAYYDNVQTQYPFMDWQTVTRWFSEVMQEESSEPAPLFFIYMICAIGSQIYNTNTAKLYTRMYYNKSLESIGYLLETTTLETVQVYLMLSVFSQKMPDASSIWQTTGLAIRTSVILGLHREPYRKNKEDKNQLRYWIFWSAYGLERINGCVLGRPFCISDIDIDVSLPEPPEPTVAMHVIKIRRIQSHICSFIYRPVRLINSDQDVDTTRRDIVLELNEWMSTFPHKQHSSSMFETEYWREITYHNSMLLLLRPVVLEVAQMKGRVSDNKLEWFKAFTHSASSICHNYKGLHSRGKLVYTWLGMHCVFVSGLSFLYCAWIDATNCLKLLDNNPVLYDTINASSSILHVLAERFTTAVVFRDTFDRVVRCVMSLINKNTPQMASTSSTGIKEYLGYKLTTQPNPELEMHELWDFLDTTGDKFLKDIFNDMEGELKYI